MTILTEGPHTGGFLIWEVLRDFTRETVTLASGTGKLAPGTVLGKLTTGGKYKALRLPLRTAVRMPRALSGAQSMPLMPRRRAS